MKRDFYFRLAAASLAMTGMAVFIAAAAILPAYFQSAVKKSSAEDRLAAIEGQNVPTEDQQALAVINDLDAKLSIVENAEKNTFDMPQAVVRELVVIKPSDIKITQLSYALDPQKGKTVSIRGTAPSRERLLAFQKILQSDAKFKSVDVPISNFIQDSNLQFFITLVAVP